MIITQKKPSEELLGMLEGATNVIISGCGECATVCRTGGTDQIEEMKTFLEEHGKKVLGTMYPQTGCNKLLIKKELKQFKEIMPQVEAIVSLSCGDGTQTLAGNVEKPVYPGNNTMFLGEIERITLFSEACRFCGDCVLGNTGGICPVTKCAKSLMNGPCGGARNGMCEVNPENPCAWIEIYKRLKMLGQVEKMEKIADNKNYASFAYPRTIDLKKGGNADE